MPTTDKDKNLEYVKKSQAKKKEALGVKEYNKINADAEQRHRDKLKVKLGQEEYKRQQAERPACTRLSSCKGYSTGI